MYILIADRLVETWEDKTDSTFLFHFFSLVSLFFASHSLKMSSNKVGSSSFLSSWSIRSTVLHCLKYLLLPLSFGFLPICSLPLSLLFLSAPCPFLFSSYLLPAPLSSYLLPTPLSSYLLPAPLSSYLLPAPLSSGQTEKMVPSGRGNYHHISQTSQAELPNSSLQSRRTPSGAASLSPHFSPSPYLFPSSLSLLPPPAFRHTACCPHLYTRLLCQCLLCLHVLTFFPMCDLLLCLLCYIYEL